MRRKLTENYKRVAQRIRLACERVGRNPDSVTMVAVTKYASLDIVRAMVSIGIPDLGESRVQELSKRAASINEWLHRHPREAAGPVPARPTWHMVGHLQRNKVKTVLPWVDLIHSVDSLRLAEEIDMQSARLGRTTPILLQVNVADASGKFGVAVAAVTHLAEQIDSLEHVTLRGMMAMAPLTDDTDTIRHVFGRARELYDEIVGQKLCSPEFRDLSLGMSKDFEYGIEAGATFVRIGSALLAGIELAAEPAHAD